MSIEPFRPEPKEESISSELHSAPIGTPKPGFLFKFTGFAKVSTLVLFILSAGYFSFFCTVHVLIYLRQNGTWDTPLTNGERFWVLNDSLKYFLNQLHLWSVIPTGIFLPLQFLPSMRRKYVTAHRIAGRVLFGLLGLGTITGLKLSMTAFGETLHTKLYGTLLALGCSYGTYKSLASIRNLQIDEHRIWVLRTWAYAGSILSLRMMLLPTLVVFATFSLHSTTFLNCGQIGYIYHEKYKGNETMLQQQLSSMYSRYPNCLNLAGPAIEMFVPVEARIRFEGRLPEQATALYNTIFGFCGLAGLLFNVIAVEFYIRFTKQETERLKKVSAGRRKAAERQEEATVFKKRFMHVVKEEPEAVDLILLKGNVESATGTEIRRRQGRSLGDSVQNT